MQTPIHNNYDDQEEDEFVDSCSCTDVTLDETLKINHNHRKSMARKKKLQTQRLRELQKVESNTQWVKISKKSAILESRTICLKG